MISQFKPQMLKKPNSALVMMPKVGRMTAVSRKMFNVMLQLTQSQAASITGAGQVIQASHLFRARLSEIIEPVMTGEANILTHAKHSLREMRRVELDWEAPDANSEVVWVNMSLLSEVRILKEKSSQGLIVEWALPPGLIEVISDPSRFTPIDIQQLSQLRTYTAVALYEIAARYRNNPSGVTSEQSVDWWMSALSQTPAPKDPVTKAPKSRNWAKFKDDQLNAAIEEINSKTDLMLTLGDKKTGKKITSAQFKVARKTVNELESGNPYRLSEELALFATKLNLRLSEVRGLRQLGKSEAMIAAALLKLADRVARDDLEPVASRIAYLRKVIEELSGHTTSVSPTVAATADIAPKPLTVSVDATDSLASVGSKVKAELMDKDPAVIARFAELAFEELQAKGMATSSIVRQMTSGSYSGMLLSKMVDLFAFEQYGPNWRTLSIPTS